MKNQIGNFLKDAREAKGFTQTQVAEAYGYKSPQFISNIERGIAAPPVETLVFLSKLYKVKTEKVLDLAAEREKRALYARAKKVLPLKKALDRRIKKVWQDNTK